MAASVKGGLPLPLPARKGRGKERAATKNCFVAEPSYGVDSRVAGERIDSRGRHAAGSRQSGYEEAYARWAPVYDALCGPFFLSGGRVATQAARAIGGHIGVGTGLSFDDYSAATEITGIDISEPMIAWARERLDSGLYPFVRELRVMDAHAPR